MKTILAEALTPVLDVSAKIPCAESLLLFHRRDGKAHGCLGWTRKLRSHGTMQGSVYGYSQDIATEDHPLLHQISNPRPPYADRTRCQLSADTDIIPLNDTNMAVFIGHCVHVTVFHMSPIPIIQFSPKVLTTRIAVSPFAGFVKNAITVNGDGWAYHPMVGISSGYSCGAMYPGL
jgi:hypothetical protein